MLPARPVASESGNEEALLREPRGSNADWTHRPPTASSLAKSSREEDGPRRSAPRAFDRGEQAEPLEEQDSPSSYGADYSERPRTCHEDSSIDQRLLPTVDAGLTGHRWSRRDMTAAPKAAPMVSATQSSQFESRNGTND